MVRPTGWDILGLDGDPTPGVVESVQSLAKEFGDFADDVQDAYHALNSFGADATALTWVGQTADAFKGQFGPLPGRQDTSLLRNRSDSSWRNLAATSAHRGDPVVLRSVADRRALAGEPLHLES